MLTCKISTNGIAKLVTAEKTIKVYRYSPNDFRCDGFTGLNLWNKVLMDNQYSSLGRKLQHEYILLSTQFWLLSV